MEELNKMEESVETVLKNFVGLIKVIKSSDANDTQKVEQTAKELIDNVTRLEDQVMNSDILALHYENLDKENRELEDKFQKLFQEKKDMEEKLEAVKLSLESLALN